MEQICGIKINADTINIEPHFPSDINSASASFNSVFGKVSVKWKRENGQIIFELEYPKNAKGTFKYKDYILQANKTDSKIIITE